MTWYTFFLLARGSREIGIAQLELKNLARSDVYIRVPCSLGSTSISPMRGGRDFKAIVSVGESFVLQHLQSKVWTSMVQCRVVVLSTKEFG